ncbi:MAG: FmdB family transcriptional regulator [Pseudonocardia sp.]|nr:FmdB family transcriptional regulator [Pseudonocardia sp.]
MPTYQYACTACGHRFEAVQRFSDASLTDCPECAGRLRKVFSSVGIVFKGSGFYRTDSRVGASDGPAKEKVSADSSTSSGSGDAKSPSSSDSSSKKPDSGSSSSSTSASTSPSTSSSTSSAPAAAASA